MDTGNGGPKRDPNGAFKETLLSSSSRHMRIPRDKGPEGPKRWAIVSVQIHYYLLKQWSSSTYPYLHLKSTTVYEFYKFCYLIDFMFNSCK